MGASCFPRSTRSSVMRSLSDGEREIWNDLQRDAAPDERDYRVLSKREHTRGQTACPCDHCDAAIQSGQRYVAVSLINEGKFELIRHHVGICPKIQAAMSEGGPPDWSYAEEDLF